MEKNEFILKVVGLQSVLDNPNIVTSYDFDRDWVRELMSEDGYTISISAWEPGEGFMIDQHITGLYPEIARMGVEELQEGDMYYSGGMSVSGIVNQLTRMGFTVSENAPQPDTPSTQQITPQVDVDDLKSDMEQAVGREDYEEAARIRDVIRGILKESFDEWHNTNYK